MKYSKHHIVDFAQSHDIGMDVFVNRRTGEIIELPNTYNRIHVDLDEHFIEEQEKLEEMWHEVDKFKCPNSNESYEILVSFINNLPESILREKLIKAVNRRKPFRNFNHIIHNSDKREQWFKHKKTELENRIIKIIAEIKTIE